MLSFRIQYIVPIAIPCLKKENPVDWLYQASHLLIFHKLLKKIVILFYLLQCVMLLRYCFVKSQWDITEANTFKENRQNREVEKAENRNKLLKIYPHLQNDSRPLNLKKQKEVTLPNKKEGSLLLIQLLREEIKPFKKISNKGK